MLAIHQAGIIKNGHAYPIVTANLLELMTQAGLSGEAVEKLLLQHGNDWLEPVKAQLMTGLKTKRVGSLLAMATSASVENLRQKLAVQQRNAPLQSKE